MKLTAEQKRLRKWARRYADHAMLMVRLGRTSDSLLCAFLAAHHAFQAHPELRPEEARDDKA